MINASLKLCRVPFNETSNFIFDKGLLSKYLEDKQFLPLKVQYQQPRQEITFMVEVSPEDFQKLETFNYALYTVDSNEFYYFISSYSRVSAKVLSLTLKMDCLNTYDYLLRPAIYNKTFVKREHTAIDAPQFRGYINDTPEEGDVSLAYTGEHMDLIREPLLCIRYVDDRPYLDHSEGTQRQCFIPAFRSKSFDENDLAVSLEFEPLAPNKGAWINFKKCMPMYGIIDIRPSSLAYSSGKVPEVYPSPSKWLLDKRSNFTRPSTDIDPGTAGLFDRDYSLHILFDLYTGEGRIYKEKTKFRFTQLENTPVLKLNKFIKEILVPNYKRDYENFYFFPKHSYRMYKDEGLYVVEYLEDFRPTFVGGSPDIRVKPLDWYPLDEPFVKSVKELPVSAIHPFLYEKTSNSTAFLQCKNQYVIGGEALYINIPLSDDVLTLMYSYNMGMGFYEECRKSILPESDTKPYGKVKNLKLCSPQFGLYQLLNKDSILDIPYYQTLSVPLELYFTFSPSFSNSLIVSYNREYTDFHPRISTTLNQIQATNFINYPLSVDEAEQQMTKLYPFYEQQTALQERELDNKQAVINEQQSYERQKQGIKGAQVVTKGIKQLMLTAAMGPVVAAVGPASQLAFGAGASAGLVSTVLDGVSVGMDNRHTKKVAELSTEANGINREILHNEINTHKMNIAMSSTSSIVGDTGLMQRMIDKLGERNMEISELRVPQIEQERLNTVFHYTGFACNRVKVPDFDTMNRFNYVQAVLALHETEAPLFAEKAYAEKFEEGVTVFHKIDDIYQELHNRPLLGKGND